MSNTSLLHKPCTCRHQWSRCGLLQYLLSQDFTSSGVCYISSVCCQELSQLLAQHKEAEETLTQARQELQQQKEAYDKLQNKHIQQLDEIRQAGHEALAVVVEEFKVSDSAASFVIVLSLRNLDIGLYPTFWIEGSYLLKSGPFQKSVYQHWRCSATKWGLGACSPGKFCNYQPQRSTFPAF